MPDILITAPTSRQLIATDLHVRVLDVRWRLDRPDGRPDCLAGHIPGAVYVDLGHELAEHGALVTEGRHRGQLIICAAEHLRERTDHNYGDRKVDEAARLQREIDARRGHVGRVPCMSVNALLHALHDSRASWLLVSERASRSISGQNSGCVQFHDRAKDPLEVGGTLGPSSGQRASRRRIGLWSWAGWITLLKLPWATQTILRGASGGSTLRR